jgi:hypothetical protein
MITTFRLFLVALLWHSINNISFIYDILLLYFNLIMYSKIAYFTYDFYFQVIFGCFALAFNKSLLGFAFDHFLD